MSVRAIADGRPVGRVAVPAAQVFLQRLAHLDDPGRDAVEDELTIREAVRDPFEQLPHVGFVQVHQQAFGDDQDRLACGDSGQPRLIGHRRADHVVSAGLLVKLAAQFDDVGQVDIEPAHPGGQVEPERPAVQTTGQVPHSRVGVAA